MHFCPKVEGKKAMDENTKKSFFYKSLKQIWVNHPSYLKVQENRNGLKKGLHQVTIFSGRYSICLNTSYLLLKAYIKWVRSQWALSDSVSISTDKKMGRIPIHDDVRYPYECSVNGA